MLGLYVNMCIHAYIYIYIYIDTYIYIDIYMYKHTFFIYRENKGHTLSNNSAGYLTPRQSTIGKERAPRFQSPDTVYHSCGMRGRSE